MQGVATKTFSKDTKPKKDGFDFLLRVEGNIFLNHNVTGDETWLSHVNISV